MRLIMACLLLMLSLTLGLSHAQETPEATETAEPPTTITIWWPDTFARVGDEAINPILLEQADAFAEQFPNVIFEHRLKVVGQTGGIMSTLRSASNAARAALPTLTLVRRQDLLLAETNGYLQSLEGFSSSILGDLNNALILGQVSDVLYGLPYLLELQHVVYRPEDNVDYDDWTFNAVLERGDMLIFPAGRATSLNDVIALQYLASGGMPPFNNGLTLTENGLETLFNYYQSSVDEGLIDESLLSYTTSETYRADFVRGEITEAVFTSTQYLSLLNDLDDLSVAPIPTETGETVSFLNGWVWVMVAEDDDEQQVALDYLNWLFNAERQARVANAVGWLPSRERTIRNSLSDQIDTQFYLDMIENSVLPLAESEIGALGREIQTQFASILTEDKSADEALTTVISSVGQ